MLGLTLVVYSVGPPYSQVLQPRVQPTGHEKILGGKVPESSKKTKLEFAAHRQLFT